MKTMLRADFRRMLTTPLFYIMALICLAMPVLILVMTTMTAGTAAFTSVWQIIASDSGAMGMDLTGMCNINLVYFMLGVFLCVFVADDFRSGYAKNLFTVHPKKGAYVLSKTAAGFAAGTVMLLAFFAGSMLGGAFSGLPFSLGSGAFGLVMCLLSKICLMAVFAPIFLLAGVFAKRRTWLSILIALFAGMLLFMTVPMMTPLNSGIINLVMCFAGGAIFSLALGKVSALVLNRSDLV